MTLLKLQVQGIATAPAARKLVIKRSTITRASFDIHRSTSLKVATFNVDGLPVYLNAGSMIADVVRDKVPGIKVDDKNNVYMEINANGIRRCIVKGIDYLDEDNYQYPYPDFWDLVHDYQKDHPSLKVIINDDCHEVSALNDSATLAAYKFAENHKIVITDKIDF